MVLQYLTHSVITCKTQVLSFYCILVGCKVWSTHALHQTNFFLIVLWWRAGGRQTLHLTKCNKYIKLLCSCQCVSYIFQPVTSLAFWRGSACIFPILWLMLRPFAATRSQPSWTLMEDFRPHLLGRFLHPIAIIRTTNKVNISWKNGIQPSRSVSGRYSVPRSIKTAVRVGHSTPC